MVPNCIWKNISGQIYHLGKVINYNITEKEMDNRGSKSLVINYNYKVKEQRVDGGLCVNNFKIFKQFKNNSHVRCILMGFEKNYQINNTQSNQIDKRFYSTSIKNTTKLLHPWFITGFADAESSFSILIQPSSKYKTNWRVKAVFAITLHKKDTLLLMKIQETLGIGKVNVLNDKVFYRVESLPDLQILIKHFDNYTLLTAKSSDYFLFRKCLDIIFKKEHLTLDGLYKLIGLRYNLNRGISEELLEAFKSEIISKKIQPVDRPEFKFKGILDPNWISGFSSGDGSFNIKIANSETTKIGSRVQLRFTIGLLLREREVIEGIAKYFNLFTEKVTSSPEVIDFEFKYIQISQERNTVTLQILNFSKIINTIIPFFENYPIEGQRSLDFFDFKEVAELMKNKKHLTQEGFERILKIKSNMNDNRQT